MVHKLDTFYFMGLGFPSQTSEGGKRLCKIQQWIQDFFEE
jgi:hypothetical protein